MTNTNTQIEKLNGLTLEVSLKNCKEIYRIVGIEKGLLSKYNRDTDLTFLTKSEYSIVLGNNEDYRLLINGSYYGEENWSSEDIVYTIAESEGWV